MTYKLIENVKLSYSLTLLVFSIVMVTTFNVEGKTQVAQDIHPAVSVLITLVGIVWLSALEGGQCTMLNLKNIKPECFEESHPNTSTICAVGYKGDNLNRYLLGRQFLVVIIIFTINICGAPLEDSHVFNLPSWIQTTFIESGIAITAIVVIIGQLPAQLNAWHCMLDYTNNSFMTFTLYVALIIEASGIMHMVYVIQYLICWLSGKPLETNEGPRSHLQALFFWGRCILSVAIFAFSMAVTLQAMLQGQTTTWDRIPTVGAVILLFVLFLVGGILEGIKMAYTAVARLPKSQREGHPIAKKTCDLLFRGEKHGLPRFWVGRQVLVTLCFVVMARMTKINVDMDVEENVFGVSDDLQTFLNLGYLGAIVTAILGSLLWQQVASIYPVEFLSNPLCYILVQLCVWLEASAICVAYALLGTIYRKVAGFERDEVYINSLGNTPGDMEKAVSTSETGNSLSMAEPQLKTLTRALTGHDQVEAATPPTPGNHNFGSEQVGSHPKSLSEHEADITANIKEMLELLEHCTIREKGVLERALALEKAALEDVKTEQRIMEAETMDDLECVESQT